MKFQLYIILALFLTIGCQKSQSLFQENSEDWIEEGNAQWSFSNSELIGTVNDGLGFVITKQAYKDFVLELEFNPDSTINSGVFIRCMNNEPTAETSYELNIWDLHTNQDFRTGAVVTKAKPLAIVETIDQWNSYKIKMENDHIKAWINDVLVADIKDSDHSDGPIGLQASGVGKIKFRNVKISSL